VVYDYTNNVVSQSGQGKQRNEISQERTEKKVMGSSSLEQKLQEALAMQVDVDKKNIRLQELLKAAETSPDIFKLQSDIKRLRLQLVEEQKKQNALNYQITESQDAIAKRDVALGLTNIKAEAARVNAETKIIASQDAKIREEMSCLNRHLTGVQSKLLILRQREGKLWIIPDKSFTTKEPILATVSASGAKLERFDRSDQTKIFYEPSTGSEFNSFLAGVKPVDQYIVFLVRPSGIRLFKDLVKSARDKNIEVGFDAVEENKDIYYSIPPVIDDTDAVSPETLPFVPGSGGYSDFRGGGGDFPRAEEGQGGATSTDSRSNKYKNKFQSTQGANGNSTKNVTNPSRGTKNTGNSDHEGQTTGAQDGGGQGTGSSNGNGNKTSKTVPAKNTRNGGASDSSTTTPTEAKKAPPATTSKHGPFPQPVVKSWWQRLLDWIGYKS